jgi:uncharacterized protein (DUF302 family)
MNKIKITATVEQATQQANDFLIAKGFKIFAIIDHSANAASVDLKLAPSQVIIFGNPLAGTKLMQADITMSLDLPLRVAFVEDQGNTYMLHQTSDDYQSQYNVKAHPVIEKIEQLYAALANSL